MMIHNFIKYLVQTRLRLLEICYFYISQTKSSLDKIFYKVVYHHIIYLCDFFFNLDNFFCYDLYGLSRNFSLHQIYPLLLYIFFYNLHRTSCSILLPLLNNQLTILVLSFLMTMYIETYYIFTLENIYGGEPIIDQLVWSLVVEPTHPGSSP